MLWTKISKLLLFSILRLNKVKCGKENSKIQKWKIQKNLRNQILIFFFRFTKVLLDLFDSQRYSYICLIYKGTPTSVRFTKVHQQLFDSQRYSICSIHKASPTPVRFTKVLLHLFDSQRYSICSINKGSPTSVRLTKVLLNILDSQRYSYIC